MTRELFVQRTKYIHPLAVRHGATERELKVIERLIDHVLEKKRLPKTVAGRQVKTILRRIIHDPKKRFGFFKKPRKSKW